MDEIKKGQKIKLCFETIDNPDVEVDCFIKEVSKDRLSLDFSDEIFRYIDDLKEGNEMIANIFTPEGIKVFDTIILNSPLEDDFIIEYVERSLKIQRRKYIRAALDAKIIIERLEFDNIITSTTEVGGGGLRFIYEGSFEPKELLGSLLYLPKQIRAIRAKGILLPNEYLPKNEHVLMFTDIDENDRSRIIKQCFEIQTAKLLENKEA